MLRLLELLLRDGRTKLLCSCDGCFQLQAIPETETNGDVGQVNEQSEQDDRKRKDAWPRLL